MHINCQEEAREGSLQNLFAHKKVLYRSIPEDQCGVKYTLASTYLTFSPCKPLSYPQMWLSEIDLVKGYLLCDWHPSRWYHCPHKYHRECQNPCHAMIQSAADPTLLPKFLMVPTVFVNGHSSKTLLFSLHCFTLCQRSYLRPNMWFIHSYTGFCKQCRAEETVLVYTHVWVQYGEASMFISKGTEIFKKHCFFLTTIIKVLHPAPLLRSTQHNDWE